MRKNLPLLGCPAFYLWRCITFVHCCYGRGSAFVSGACVFVHKRAQIVGLYDESGTDLTLLVEAMYCLVVS